MGGRADWDCFWADARATDILPLAQSLGARLKKVATHEWAGPCPACGGEDRFSINTSKNIFNCRGSEGGTPIDLVVHVKGCSVIEAVELLVGKPRADWLRDESNEDRASREHFYAARQAEYARRQEDERRRLEEQAQRDEIAIADALGRALDLDDPRASKVGRMSS
jgi:phage/plasmid primase-like uncharacterized protein